MKQTAGMVDSGNTIILLPTDAFNAYKKSTGAILDSTTGLLRISNPAKLQSLFFKIGGVCELFDCETFTHSRCSNHLNLLLMPKCGQGLTTTCSEAFLTPHTLSSVAQVHHLVKDWILRSGSPSCESIIFSRPLATFHSPETVITGRDSMPYLIQRMFEWVLPKIITRWIHQTRRTITLTLSLRL